MSKLDLQIEFDNDQRTYKIGQVIHGTVRVDVHEDCQCQALTVSCQWRTDGKGDRDRGSETKETLFDGLWRPGRHRYPFSIPVPNGPVTYHGRYLNVDQGISPPMPEITEAPILLRPDGKPYRWGIIPQHAVTPELIAYSEQATSRVLTGCAVKLSGWLLKAGAVMGLLCILAGGTIFGLSLVGISGVLLFLMHRRAIAEKRLGAVALQIDPPTVRAGDPRRCSVRFTPSANLESMTTSAQIIARECVTQRFDKSERSYTAKVYEQEQPIRLDTWIRAGQMTCAEVEFRVPNDAPPSFLSRRNGLHWEVVVRLKIPWWPDWVKKESIVVTP